MFSLGIIGYSGVIPLVHYIWGGISTGTWITNTNWTPNIVGGPDSTIAAADISTDNGTGAKTIVMGTTPQTVNQVNFINATSNWSITGSGAGILTFDGTNPQINTTHIGAISTPVTLNSSLAIIGNANLTINNPITATSKTITNTNTAIVRLNGNSSATMVSDTFIHKGYALNQGIQNCLGSTSTIVNWYNLVSGTSINYAAGTNGLANNVVLYDTGTSDWNIGSNTGLGWISGGISGTITHNLVLYQGTLYDITALVFSGSSKIICTGINYSDISGTFQSTVDIDIGDGVSVNGGLSYDSTGTIANTIRVKPCTTSAGTYNLRVPLGNNTFSGPIILNSDANGFVGSVLTWDYVGTISGVISNGASGAANITFQPNSGTLTLSNTNTYTSPTSVNGVSTILNITGSITNSTVSLNGGATLKGSGTVGPVTSIGATINKIQARSNTSPTVAQVLTIQGNLTETTKSVIHTFQSDATGASSKLQINGNIAFGTAGTIVLSTATSGKTYTVCTYTGTTSGTLWTSTQGTVTDTGTSITVAVP